MLLLFRAVLLLTSPVWGPVALVLGLARVCGDGLLFLWETWTGNAVDPPRGLRLLLDLPALVVFPLVITAETLLSTILMVGSLPGRLFGEPEAGPAPLRFVVGIILLPLSPIWLLGVVIAWMAWSLLYKLAVVPGADRLARTLRGEANGSGGAGRFSTFVALRYMRGRRAGGVNIVTGLTIMGVTVGVWTLVTVLSVMAGFEQDLQDKILGANSHVVVLSYTNQIDRWEDVAERTAEVDGVTGVTPFVYSEFMLRSRHSAFGAIFKGIDPATVASVTDLAKNIVQGPLGSIDDPAVAQALLDRLDDPLPPPASFIEDEDRTELKLPGLVIGQEMAAQLRVTVGDTVHAVSPSAEPGPMGTLQARVHPFVVAGIFHSGMYEYDTKFCYATLEQGRKIMKLPPGAVTGLEVVVDDVYDAPEIAGRIGAKLQYPYWTRDWQKMNEPLFAALKLEKVVMGLILSFIVAVASMNIISTLIMLVLEKRREIAILKAMGAGRLDLMKLFVVDGLLVGFIGTTLGISLGLITCAALDRWQFIKLESDVYYVDTLPVVLSPALVGFVALMAVAISFLATLFPSWEGSSMDPVEGLRDG